MGEQVLDLGAFVGVFVGGEPDEAVVVEVQPQGVDAGDQQVQTEVELGLVDQVRPRNVSLNYQRSGVGDLTPLVDHFDALASGQGGGLHDPPPFASFPLPNFPQQFSVRWKTKGSWQEVELGFSMF